MFKKFTIIILLLVFAFSVMPVSAANYYGHDIQKLNMVQKPVIYTDTIFVGKDGGKFDVGFVTLKFPRNFIDSDKLPIRLVVKVSAVNGVAGVEVKPDIPCFNKDVLIKVDQYNGLLYDEARGKNIWVNVKPQVLKAKHFSRYAFS